MVAASPGLPPDGKITGGTLNSFDIGRIFLGTDFSRGNLVQYTKNLGIENEIKIRRKETDAICFP